MVGLFKVCRQYLC